MHSGARNHCHYFLTRKNRYCRFQPKDGQQYCPEHACMMGVQSGCKRIPCPLNSRHNCYEDELDSHIQKCNVTKTAKATQQAVYYCRGVNKGSGGADTEKDKVQEKRQICVKDLTSAELAAMITKVNQLYQEHVKGIETVIHEHPCMRQEFCGQQGKDLEEILGNQAALRKELLQQASLVGQLEELGFLTGGHCYVELGAGKGKLSHWIQKASTDSAPTTFLLVERGSVRYKMDSFHKQGGAKSEFKRIKIDIEDLYLGKVDTVKSSDSVIVVGKHLCGGATDMGIRCAIETLGLPTSCPGPATRTEHSDHEKQHSRNHTSEDNQPSLNLPGSLPAQTSVNSLVTDSSPAEDSCSSLVDTVNQRQEDGGSVHQPQLCARLTGGEARNTAKNDEASTPGERGCGMSKDVSLVSHSKITEASDCKSFKDKSHQKESLLSSIPGNTSQENPAQTASPEPPNKTARLELQEKRLPKGIMLALCCHHRCTWDTYVGQDFMSACGVSPQEFDLLTRLSSWATCAKVTAKFTRMINSHRQQEQIRSPDANSQEGEPFEERLNGGESVEETHKVEDLVGQGACQSLREQLSVSEREAVGFKCKRLIDAGRLHYLQSRGMKSFLRRYISESTTPENVVLIALV